MADDEITDPAGALTAAIIIGMFLVPVVLFLCVVAVRLAMAIG